MPVGTARGVRSESDAGHADGGAGGATLALGTEAEFMKLLVDLSVTFAPRRFALCEVYGERADGWVFGWGMTFGSGSAMLYRDDGRPLGSFASAEPHSACSPDALICGSCGSIPKSTATPRLATQPPASQISPRRGLATSQGVPPPGPRR